jgi:hypothetical protein
MQEKTEQQPPKTEQQSQPERKPNEHAGFHFSSALRITDPETGEVLVQIRAD